MSQPANLSRTPAHPRETPSRPLPHERLDVFQLAIALVEQTARLPQRRGHAAVYDQLRRATTSVALNIAEGCGKDGRDRGRFFDIARGSALESAAALRILLALRLISQSQHDDNRSLCERSYAMLTRLAKR